MTSHNHWHLTMRFSVAQATVTSTRQGTGRTRCCGSSIWARPVRAIGSRYGAAFKNSCTFGLLRFTLAECLCPSLRAGASQSDVIRVSVRRGGLRLNSTAAMEAEPIRGGPGPNWDSAGAFTATWPSTFRFCGPPSLSPTSLRPPRVTTALTRVSEMVWVGACVTDYMCACFIFIFWMYWLLNKDLHHCLSTRCPWGVFLRQHLSGGALPLLPCITDRLPDPPPSQLSPCFFFFFFFLSFGRVCNFTLWASSSIFLFNW